MKILRTLGLALLMLAALTSIAGAQTWTALTHQPTFSASNPLLMTDGTVIAHATSSTAWWRLTPDINGSYINGTWSQIASLQSGYAPLYFGSVVLADGNVLIAGGEYNMGTAVWTNMGSYYDAVHNTWTAVNPPTMFTMIGDAEATLLPNGTPMQTDCCDVPPQAGLFNEAVYLSNPTQNPNNYWSFTGAGKFDIYDEEGLAKLPNGNILTVDAYVFQYDATGTNSEIYNTPTGTWSSAGSTIVQMWDSYPNEQNASYEEGPSSLRPDGTVIWTGATGAPNTPGAAAVYNTHSGTWSPAPSFPTTNGVNNLDCADAPAALLPSGNVLVATSPGIFHNGVQFFEWNGSTWTNVPGTARSPREPSYVDNMVELPTGQILMTDNGRFVYIYTPTGSANPAWAPIIVTTTSGTQTYVRGNTYVVHGARFNGQSMGATYGDDISGDSNYPVIRFTNNTTGHVFYGKTTYTSTAAGLSYGVQTPGPMMTNVTVPAGAEIGLSQMVVTVNGIASNAVTVNIQ